ncbi:YafY family protein [Flavobacterium antarcticum]|uniref:helix-turn-helix transcriptional regulator n=1 Tax=Flavobacterium antarcticum TaxID=271155 RepID=UPI0003B35027|nr:WYL domain-containing protein [Flavobacterium antarcticum]
MSKQRFIKRYSLIINLVRRKPSSFDIIKKYLQEQSIIEEENFEVELRTFQRDLKEIESLFGIKIRKNRAKDVYEIVENSDEDSEKHDRLMESFEVFNVLNLSNQFENEIIVEKRKPLGLEHIYTLLSAIKKKHEVQFTHEKYWTEEEEKHLKQVQPIALKEARFRWYLIAKDKKDNIIKTFGLDRISDLKVLENTFVRTSNYDAKSAFQHSFGIVTKENEIPEKVILSFSQKQGKFIKSFPLHHSQKTIIDNETELRVELLIHLTYDFIMELLSIGAHVKILQPKILQEEIKRRLNETLSLYS